MLYRNQLPNQNMILVPLPSIFSIIFHMAGRTDWWNPNHTSLPPPRGWSYPSGAEKNERPTGVYLQKIRWHVQSFPSNTAGQGTWKQRQLTYYNDTYDYKYTWKQKVFFLNEKIHQHPFWNCLFSESVSL